MSDPTPIRAKAQRSAQDLALALERIAAEVRAGKHVACLVVAVDTQGNHQIAQSTLGGSSGYGSTKDVVMLLGALEHAKANTVAALVRALDD